MKNIEMISNIVAQEYYGNTAQVKLALLSAVAATRGDVTKKVNLYVYGQSGAGKTKLQHTVGQLLPNLAAQMGGITARWAMYSGNELPDNSVLLVDESGTIPQIGEALLRTMADMTPGESDYGLVDNGRANTLRVNKKVTLWRNSVELSNDEQLMNRFLPVELVLTSDYQDKVRDYIRLNKRMDEEAVENAKELLRTIVGKSVQVVVPFRIRISDHAASRRYSIILNLFEAYVLLDNIEKEQVDESLTATREQFNDFREIILAANVLREDTWTKEQRAIMEIFRGTDARHPKGIGQLEDELRQRGILISTSTIRRVLYDLREYISQLEIRGPRGMRFYYQARPVATTGNIWIEEEQNGTEPTEPASV